MEQIGSFEALVGAAAIIGLILAVLSLFKPRCKHCEEYLVRAMQPGETVFRLRCPRCMEEPKEN